MNPTQPAAEAAIQIANLMCAKQGELGQIQAIIQTAIEKALEARDDKWRDSLAGKSRFCPCNEPPSMHGYDEHQSRASDPSDHEFLFDVCQKCGVSAFNLDDNEPCVVSQPAHASELGPRYDLPAPKLDSYQRPTAHASGKRHHYSQHPNGGCCICGRPIDHPIHFPMIDP